MVSGAIEIARTEHDTTALRGLAARARDVAQSRRLAAIVMVTDGSSDASRQHRVRDPAPSGDQHAGRAWRLRRAGLRRAGLRRCWPAPDRRRARGAGQYRPAPPAALHAGALIRSAAQADGERLGLPAHPSSVQPSSGTATTTSWTPAKAPGTGWPLDSSVSASREVSAGTMTLLSEIELVVSGSQEAPELRSGSCRPRDPTCSHEERSASWHES